jgi:carboxypeptidase D
MFPSLQKLFLLSAATSLATTQFVPAPTDLKNATGYMGIPVRYKEVPTGICELDPNVKSYSGYVDVAENEHIFFWFFEARNIDPKDAPLTVWINGGPGSSSMIGLWQENGPCWVDYDGNVNSNEYSWSNASNMLYIDQPTQVYAILPTGDF